MNLSGRAVKRIRADFAVAVDEIIVVHDDADLPLGSLKIKKGGSSAGHGGIESIIQHLGDNSFARVRVGIGRDKKDLKDYVLGEFSSSEKKVLESVIDSAIKAIFTFVDKGIDETMLKFNKRMQEITNEQNSK
jgi:PTH1 family peptidyl-tRNA hydrolase